MTLAPPAGEGAAGVETVAAFALVVEAVVGFGATAAVALKVAAVVAAAVVSGVAAVVVAGIAVGLGLFLLLLPNLVRWGVLT